MRELGFVLLLVFAGCTALSGPSPAGAGMAPTDNSDARGLAVSVSSATRGSCLNRNSVDLHVVITNPGPDAFPVRGSLVHRAFLANGRVISSCNADFTSVAPGATLRGLVQFWTPNSTITTWELRVTFNGDVQVAAQAPVPGVTEPVPAPQPAPSPPEPKVSFRADIYAKTLTVSSAQAVAWTDLTIKLEGSGCTYDGPQSGSVQVGEALTFHRPSSGRCHVLVNWASSGARVTDQWFSFTG